MFENWISGSCESSMSISGWVLSWCVSRVNNRPGYRFAKLELSGGSKPTVGLLSVWILLT